MTLVKNNLKTYNVRFILRDASGDLPAQTEKVKASSKMEAESKIRRKYLRATNVEAS